MQRPHFKVGVIISTYNNPVWLEKTLLGYLSQSLKADEIIIADDGSKDDTFRLIKEYSFLLPLKHVWHEDKGFRKTQILNKAVVEAKSDYLIFTDQDCIPREDFIASHVKSARKGYFLSGGYFRLPKEISDQLTKEDISSHRAFSLKFLHNLGLGRSFKATKLFKSPLYAKVLNFLTPARASWNGCNSSTWREDILKVNGFNEKMHYGGEDREFGERLINLGLKALQRRYSLITLHLYHERPYKNQEQIKLNDEIRKIVRKEKTSWTPYGIEKTL